MRDLSTTLNKTFNLNLTSEEICRQAEEAHELIGNNLNNLAPYFEDLLQVIKLVSEIEEIDQKAFLIRISLAFLELGVIIGRCTRKE